MPRQRCQFCPAPPLEEVAVSGWTDDPADVRRETIPLCRKHRQRGVRYKAGFW